MFEYNLSVTLSDNSNLSDTIIDLIKKSAEEANQYFFSTEERCLYCC